MNVVTGFSSHSNSTSPESTKVFETVAARPSSFLFAAFLPRGRRRLTERVYRGFQVAKSMVSDN